ncbi:MAG: single-stranded DNA-binding protein [Clostridiales bacterium]|jgi:single-strand DNA-binding protein|nr:single-stranded DNA-binding protein [Clostridiales bacterium]
MASFNLVVLIGHLVADPELKTTQNGTPVTSFRIGVNRRFSQGEQQTDFIDIVCWRKTAEFVTKYFSKGKPILVRGYLQTRTWTDNNNNKRFSTEVVAEEVSFVGRKDDYTGGGMAAGSSLPNYSTPVPEGSFEELSADDELPF